MKDIFCCLQGKELSKISCSEDYITVNWSRINWTRVKGVSAEEITSAPTVWLEKQLKEFQSEGDWQSYTSPLCGGLSDGTGAILFSIRAQKAVGWVQRGNTVRFLLLLLLIRSHWAFLWKTHFKVSKECYIHSYSFTQTRFLGHATFDWIDNHY